MRKLLVVFALVVVGGGLLGWLMQQDSGYVLIAYRDYTIDTSLWVMLVILGVVALVLRSLNRLWRWINTPGRGLQGWFNSRDRGRVQTTLGLLQFAEGRWEQSKSTLKRSIRRSDAPLINCLTAARAAYEAGDLAEARELLVRARGLSTGNNLAIELLQARMYLREGQYQEGVAILARIHEQQPIHIEVLRLLLKAYRETGDWENLRGLMPSVYRVKPITDNELLILEIEVYSHLLKANETDAAKLLQLWENMPSRVRKSCRVVEIYVTSLHRAGESAKAELLLRKILESEWDASLVRLYGIVEAADDSRQLLKAESWLSAHPVDANLLLTLGRLCQRNQLWGKARDYLESSLSVKSEPETCGELARLLAQMGETEKSAHYYQQGLQLYSKNA